MSSQGQPEPSPGHRVRDFSLPELGEAAPAGAEAGQAPARPVEEGGFIPIYLQERPENPLEVAQRQADELMASAQGQATAIRQKSQEEGYQTGYQAGLEEGVVASRARIEAACDNLGRALTILERAREGVLSVLEEEIIALVQAVTDRILLAPDAVDPDLIRRVAREAIGRVAQAERLTVQLNGDDLERVREFRPRLLEGMGRLKYLDLVADPDLRPGDCLVEGPQSQVDATLATRRRRIFNLLEETFHQAQRLDLAAALDQALAGPTPAAGDAPAPQAAPVPRPAAAQPPKAQPAAPAPPAAPARPEPPAPELEDW
ncbi:MAG: hypothetical protein HY794_16480 [Desulfarculus sp.]|nr:hypothetical protein [Desulfarculus sp.]